MNIVDNKLCPLCGGLTHCAMENGRSVESCWCMTAAIPEGLTAQLPKKRQGCVCQACLHTFIVNIGNS